MTELHTTYLSLGSNLGNRKNNIETALAFIAKRIGKIVATSSLYETLPQGFESENMFLNAVCKVETFFSVKQTLAELQCIEFEMGRKTKSVNNRYVDRIIDIDILLFDSIIVNEPTLVVPHPQMHKRRFVLEPLAEIAPDYEHPCLQKTIALLLHELLLQN